MNKHFSRVVFALAIVTGLVCYNSCKKIEIVQTTTSDVNIYEYLAEHPDTFSLMTKILDKTGYAGFLNAYGSYTLFAPTNTAINAWLQQINKPSIDAVDVDDLKTMVKFHLLEDTINTSQFKDGKLPRETMLGQYLVSGVDNVNGVSKFSINRQALVIEPNIRTGNGLIHGIDNVLKPATMTLAKMIEQDPKYSIFTEALKATGYYDSLNIENNPDTTRRFLTVFAETNLALADSLINSFAELRAKYSQKKAVITDPQDPYLYPATDPKDSVHLYVAYHINPGANYLADIVTTSSLTTLAPLEVLSTKLQGQTVLLNDLDFNGVHENGIALDRASSDNSATNGVLHTATAHFAIKNRQPVPVYWDVADFPEVRKLASVFRKAKYSFAPGTIQDIQWENTASMQPVVYNYSGPNSGNFFVNYGDYLSLPIGLTNSARSKWFEFRTPLLVKGRYKVWICYRQQKQSGRNPPFPLRTLFDGEPFSRLFDFQETVPSGTDGELEALGWKHYAAESNAGYMAGRLLGTVDVKTTDRHIFRIEALTGGGQSTNNLDMIHFIPVNMNQINTRFNRDGSVVIVP